MSPIVDVTVEDERWSKLCDAEALAQAAVDAVLARIEASWSGDLEISFLFCNDEKIRGLNATWNNKDSATNVLSFPASPMIDNGPLILLGDVIIAFETISNEALDQHKTIPSHAAHMLVHGVLHLFGYDHLTDDAAAEMESLETNILQMMGITDPWADLDNSGLPL